MDKDNTVLLLVILSYVATSEWVKIGCAAGIIILLILELIRWFFKLKLLALEGEVLRKKTKL